MKNQVAQRLVGISLSAVLTTVALGAVLPASAVELTEDTVADELGLNLEHGLVLAQVNLTESDGSALKEEVVIQAFAWPSTELLEAQQEGETLPLTLVGVGVSNSGDSSVDIKLDEDAARSLIKVGEPVDISLLGQTTEGDINYGFTVNTEEIQPQVQTTARGAFTTSQRSELEPREIDLVPGEASQLPEDSQEVAQPTQEPYREKSAKCYLTLKQNLGKKLVAVGSGAQNTKNIKHTFTYKKGGVTTLGVGISATGKKGSFKSSGEVSRKSDSTTTWPAKSGSVSREYKTYYTYGRYAYTCHGMFKSWSQEEIRPISYAGGAQYSDSSKMPTATKCVNHVKGSKFTKDTSKATTWSNGASLKSVIGIDLSSQAGYTEAVSIKFEFTGAGKLCGSNDYPGGKPNRLVGKG